MNIETIIKELNNQIYKTINLSKISLKTIKTRMGEMVIVATDKGVCLFEFADYKYLKKELLQIMKNYNGIFIIENHHYFDLLISQLEEYFKEKRSVFDIKLDMIGTDFQKTVWNSLLKIPYGQTISYKQQADILRKPSAVRAVANANGQNKISILIPCHRVIGSNGSLTGFGGGIERKKMLLELESRNKY